MNRWILILAAAMMTIGCSKGGAKSHLMDGAQASQPTLTDTPLSGPDGKPAPTTK